jgi:hypothetical protein
MTRTIRAVMCLIFLAYLSPSSEAKTPVKPAAKPLAPVAETHWDKEPSSFLGFDLGQRLPATLSPCPKNSLGYDDSSQLHPDETCLMGKGRVFQLWWPPQLGFPYGNNIFLWNGKIEEVRLTTKAEDYPNLKSLLITRYGPPTRSSFVSVKTVGGGDFTSEKCVWAGKDVVIRLSQSDDTIDQSSVTVTDLALEAEEDKDLHAKEVEASSKL